MSLPIPRKPNWEAIVTSLLMALITCLSPDAHYTFTPGNTSKRLLLSLMKLLLTFRKYYACRFQKNILIHQLSLRTSQTKMCLKLFWTCIRTKWNETKAAVNSYRACHTISSMIGYGGITEFYRKFKDYFSLTPVKWEAKLFSHITAVDKSHFTEVLPIDKVLWEISASCRSSGLMYLLPRYSRNRVLKLNVPGGKSLPGKIRLRLVSFYRRLIADNRMTNMAHVNS